MPDAKGVLHCYDIPNDQPKCVPKAGPCTINADCCPGTLCVRPVGSTTGTCGDNSGGSGGAGGSGGSGGMGGSGGTGGMGGTDMPSCSQYGQQCTTGADCCNNVPCDQGVCRVPLG